MLRVATDVPRTDTGRQRQANEDAYFARAPVFAVADGMGGAQAGEVASQMAVALLEPDLPDGGPVEDRLRTVVERANREIHGVATKDPNLSGMGTTMTVAHVGEEEVTLAHVGDSRAYVFRGGKLRRLTRDHSLVEELRRQGRLSAEEAETHPQRSIITRALGPEPTVVVDTQTVPAAAGDTFLLCSDGLTTMLDESRIESALADGTDLASAVDALVAAANEAGGRDNITVVAFRLEEVGAPEGGVDEPATDEHDAIEPEVPDEDEPDEEEPDQIAATRIARPGSGGEALAAGGVAGAATAERTAAASASRSRSRRRAGRRAGAIVLTLAISVGLALLGLWGVRQIYFLGGDGGGRVALYRGLPYDLPLGIRLYDERYASPIQVDSLPARRRHSVRGHSLRTRSDALSLIRDIERSEGAGT